MMANQKPVDEIRIGRVKATVWRNGIVKLTHHKLRQPQDMGSKPAPKYPIWWLGSSETS